MTFLILGLVLFLGAHSVRIVGEDWRTSVRARIGEGPWKGGYTAVSLVGLALVVWGYGLARQAPVVLWATPLWTRHLAGLLTLVAFVMLAAAQVPGNAIKARLRHPMVLGVKVWAFAHLLANNTVADLVLFGSFLVWAVLNFRSARARARDRAAGIVYPPGRAVPTVIAVVAGVGAWVAFAFWLHLWLIGVRPFG
jgi:uncharacterized membrane protein